MEILNELRMITLLFKAQAAKALLKGVVYLPASCDALTIRYLHKKYAND